MDKNELFATMPVPQALRRMIVPAAVSQIIVLGAVPTVLSNVMSSLVRSIGHSREAGFGVTLGAVLNIVLDPVFMYWILPDGQQVLGVGLATLVSNCVSFLYFLGILWEIRSRNLLTADPRVGLPRRKTLVAVLGVGIPSATTSLLFDLDYMVVDKLMVAYSDAALAAIGIVLKVERLPLNTGIGICQGMVPLVAYNCASGDPRHRRRHHGAALAGRLPALAPPDQNRNTPITPKRPDQKPERFLFCGFRGHRAASR